jgi:hypothetical protein
MAETAQTDDFMDFEKSLLGTSASVAEAPEQVVEDTSSSIAEAVAETPEVVNAPVEQVAEPVAVAAADPVKDAPEQEAVTEAAPSALEEPAEVAVVEDAPAAPKVDAAPEASEPETIIEDDAPLEEEALVSEAPASADDEEDDDDDFDILNIFSEQATSSELGAGVHERVRLISVNGERRKDANGNLVKKQLFLKFKKFSKDNVDLGEKEVSFFIVDASKETAINNLLNFTSQVVELLSLFYTPSELETSFDPFAKVFYNADNDDRDEETVKADYDHTKIKKAVIKNEKGFIAIQSAICAEAAKLLSPFCGFEAPIFRLKLVESDDNKYIEIPRFDSFVEKAGVAKETSVLYKE